jgi:hypothetical protein
MAGALVLLTHAAAAEPDPASRLALAGRWRYALDRTDTGLAERWFARSLDGSLNIPGSLPDQGIGDPITTNTPWVGGIVDRSFFTSPAFAQYREAGRVKVPFWLQPETYYKGAAWYQRDIAIPEAWRGRRVVLHLERAHWETRVWLDERPIGTNDSLSTPHRYDLGTSVVPGKHRLTVRVDNRMVVDIGENSHSISDHTQGNWNGLVGTIELEATPPVWIDRLRFYPNAAQHSVRVQGRIGNVSGTAGSTRIQFEVLPLPPGPAAPTREPLRHAIEAQFDVSGGDFETRIGLPPDAPCWDEFNPALHRVTVRLESNGQTVIGQFGLRDFAADGTQFVINGRRLFLRGTLECAIFPRTGHTPTDIETWRTLMRTAKAHGLNNLRFHSHCPPEAAFQAADELGLYLHVECGTWPNQSTTLGDGKPVDAWLYREADRILDAYGNHPSFVLLLHGNEPGGNRHTAYLKQWVEHYKARDSRRLYSSGAGWPQIPENQFHVTPDPRVQAWGGGLNSRFNAQPPNTLPDYRQYVAARPVPVVSHEIGQWCVYPNFDEIPKYTGYLKPRNFEIFRESLASRGLLAQARAFLLASGKLQTLCYKEDIESALRTPGMAGFQLLDLHDFPGQGTALVGVLDPFWEPKGYVSADQFHRFCNATVPLARLPKRVFTTDETLKAELDVAHFGPSPLAAVGTTVRLIGDDGQTRFSSLLAPQDVPVGNDARLGTLGIALANLPAPARYKLVVGLSGTPFENDWDLWVYPPKISTNTPANVTVVTDLDAAALDRLEQGGRVLWMLSPKRVQKAAPAPVVLGFSSIFWNTAWTARQPPTTLGILCDPKHPLFASFPTDYHSNWQWWYLIHRAAPLLLDDLPRDLRPTVQVIDDWVTNHKLGLLLEARIGAGSIVVCSIDLDTDPDADPVRRQFRRTLLDYMAGDAFRPAVTLTADQVRNLASVPGTFEKLGAHIRASSEHPGHEAALAIDNDPATLWHTSWNDPKPGFPHQLILEFPAPVRLTGLTVQPRQDNNRNGWIKDYAVRSGGPDGTGQEIVVESSFPADAATKRIRFPVPVLTRSITLEARSGHANGPWAAVAELGVIQ